MTNKRKWIVWFVIAAILTAVGYVGWGIASIPRILRDCYGQWVTAELVNGFQQLHGRPAINWQELEPIYGDGQGLHHGGSSFSQVQQRMVVEFSRLGELQMLAQTTTNATNIPRIVYTKSGTRSHWQGAEPNRMIYEYFVQHRNSTNSAETGFPAQ